jgi:two-component system CheB/CheR fusion protein
VEFVMKKKTTEDGKAAEGGPEESQDPAGERNQAQETAKPFPIVGLGASAGGLEALKTFFSHVSKESGMAYIVVVHMTPKQPSMMPDLLQKVAPIPVSAARDGEDIQPDRVYIIPPDREITVYQGRIQLLDTVKKGHSLPIDLLSEARG